jgi:NAD-dependent SIR2 family protein deacetylase
MMRGTLRFIHHSSFRVHHLLRARPRAAVCGEVLRSKTHKKGNADSLSAALNLFVIGSSGRVKILAGSFVGVRVGELTRVLRV